MIEGETLERFAARNREGEGLFIKGCAACHSIGDGVRVGPDLEGVTLQVGDREGFVPRKSAPGTELFYGYRSPEDWRARVEAAGFTIDDLVSEVSETEQSHLNEGSRGWSTAIARKRA